MFGVVRRNCSRNWKTSVKTTCFVRWKATRLFFNISDDRKLIYTLCFYGVRYAPKRERSANGGDRLGTLRVYTGRTRRSESRDVGEKIVKKPTNKISRKRDWQTTLCRKKRKRTWPNAGRKPVNEPASSRRPRGRFSPVIAPMRPTDRRIWQAPGRFAPPLRSFVLYFSRLLLWLLHVPLCAPPLHGRGKVLHYGPPGFKGPWKPRAAKGHWRARDRKTRFSAARIA